MLAHIRGPNMSFVKLKCSILNSSLWCDKDARDVFLTALLMARPYVLDSPSPQLNVRDLSPTGWTTPPGEYGIVEASSSGIIRTCGIEAEPGKAALERLGAPDPESKNPNYDGRRLVRVAGGYLVLNYMAYRQRDDTVAERVARFRTKCNALPNGGNALRNACNALHPLGNALPSTSSSSSASTSLPLEGGDGGEGRGEGQKVETPQPKRARKGAEPPGFAEWYAEYPWKSGRAKAIAAWRKLSPDAELQQRMIDSVRRQNAERASATGFYPHPKLPATWLNSEGWLDTAPPPLPPKTYDPESQDAMRETLWGRKA
jgi:hypothetical protein